MSLLRKVHFFCKIGLITAIAILAQFTSASSENLKQAMIKSYNNSGLLEQNRALLRAADEDVAIATAALRTVIGWSASINQQNTESSNQLSSNLRLSAELTIYDAGQNEYARLAAKEAVLATRQKLIVVEQQVLLSAVQSFMNVIREQKIVDLRENNVRVIREELRAVRDRFDVGEVTKTDVALAEARLAASISALAAAKGTLAQAEEIYKQNIGSKPLDLEAPDSAPRLPKALDVVKKRALERHPEIISLQHEIKQAELNVDRANGSLSPVVKLSGSIGYNKQGEDEFNQSNSVTLMASGPLYSGGKIPALIGKAMALRDAKKASLHLTRMRLEKEAGSSLALLEMARASRLASEEQIRASQVAFLGVREEAALGSRTTLDVLNAEQELLDAQAGLISAVTEEFIASFRVKEKMGQLTVDELNLPVRKYDPKDYYNLVKSAPSISKRGNKLDKVLKALSN